MKDKKKLRVPDKSPSNADHKKLSEKKSSLSPDRKSGIDNSRSIRNSVDYQNEGGTKSQKSLKGSVKSEVEGKVKPDQKSAKPESILKSEAKGEKNVDGLKDKSRVSMAE